MKKNIVAVSIALAGVLIGTTGCGGTTTKESSSSDHGFYEDNVTQWGGSNLLKLEKMGDNGFRFITRSPYNQVDIPGLDIFSSPEEDYYYDRPYDDVLDIEFYTDTPEFTGTITLECTLDQEGVDAVKSGATSLGISCDFTNMEGKPETRHYTMVVDKYYKPIALRGAKHWKAYYIDPESETSVCYGSKEGKLMFEYDCHKFLPYVYGQN